MNSDIGSGGVYIPEGAPDRSLHFKELAYTYSYELFGIWLAVIYIIIYLSGCRKNNIIVDQYYEKCREFYESNFAHVGITQNPKGPIFHAESSHSFKFFASGRINCRFTQLSFELNKRQDIISNYLFSLIWPEKDQIKFDVPISVNPLPLCFAILKKKDAPTYKENNMDVKHLTQKLNLNNLDNKYICLGEDSEIMSTIFDQKLVNLLNRYDKFIYQIHLTDQKSLSLLQPQTFILKPLPPTNKQEEVLELTQMVFYLLDRIANLKLSSQVRQNCEKERKAYEELKLKDEKLRRMEELQKQKQEKKLKEQQDLLKLPREKQLQLQDKEKKEELRKRLSKRVMRM